MNLVAALNYGVSCSASTQCNSAQFTYCSTTCTCNATGSYFNTNISPNQCGNLMFNRVLVQKSNILMI